MSSKRTLNRIIFKGSLRLKNVTTFKAVTLKFSAEVNPKKLKMISDIFHTPVAILPWKAPVINYYPGDGS